MDRGFFGGGLSTDEEHEYTNRGSIVCRSGFSRDLCVIENQRLGVAGAASVATLASSKTGGSGLKPPSVSRNSFRPSYRRSGFSRDLLRHRKSSGSKLSEPLQLRPLRRRRREVRGESPSYRGPFLTVSVGVASAATFASSKTRDWELPERLPPQPLHLRRQRRGAKAHPAKGWISARGGRRERRGLA